jgi:hypothetical protein
MAWQAQIAKQWFVGDTSHRVLVARILWFGTRCAVVSFKRRGADQRRERRSHQQNDETERDFHLN